MPPKKTDATKPLKLVSPFGGEAALFKWPLEHNDGGNEIVDIMKSVCEDYPELALPIKNHIIKDFDSTNYESVKSCCDKFNRAIAQLNLLFSGTYRPGKHRANPSRKLLKHIIQLSYNRAVDDPEKLNEYEPFSPQVYGETSFDLICKMLDDVPVKETDTFIDLGSGVGQVVLQVAALTNCKMCYGIEKSQICVEYSAKLEKEFRFWMNWYGKVYTDFELIKGDFLDKNYAQIITNCSLIFVNNFAFGPNVDHQLKLRFQNLHDGTRIVASKAFAPIKFRASGRNMSDIASIMRVSELATLKGSVSWTENPVSYFLHVIDTTLLENFFEQQKVKSSSRSGSDDTGSEKTDSCESNAGGRSDVDSPPISVAAAENNEKNEAPAASTSTAVTNQPSVTTSKKTTSQSAKISRKYPRRSSRKSILSAVRNIANDSSSSTSSGNEKKPLSEFAESASKQTVTTSPSTRGGAHGRRKPTRKSTAAVSPVSESGSKRGMSPSAAKHRKMSPRVASGPTATESGLELLHSHSVMSTKGELSDFPVSSGSFSPKREQSGSRSATYKELNVRVEDLEALPTPVPSSGIAENKKEESEPIYVPGLEEFMANMKNKYIEFVEQLQSPQYGAMLQLKIQEERERGQLLRGKIQEVKDDIREMEKDFVQLLHCRLKELGIDARTPVEFVEKAKGIISVHETLRMRTREEQELYNREYEMLQRNIEARRQEYEEIAHRLHREQGTVLPPFDVNLLLNVKQQPSQFHHQSSSSAARAGGGGGTLSSSQMSSESPSADISPSGRVDHLLKRSDIIDLDTLIATQLQQNSNNGDSSHSMFRLPNSAYSSGTGTAAPPVNVSMCRGCGGVAAQKNIPVSPASGFCVECEQGSVGGVGGSHGKQSATGGSPRTHHLLQRSLETALNNTGRMPSSSDELGSNQGRTGSCFSIDSLVSPRLHQAVDSQLSSTGLQHSDHGSSHPSNFCLPLSATLSSPILRANLTNPPIQQKTMGDIEKMDERSSGSLAHEGMAAKRYQISPITRSPSASGTNVIQRAMKHALSFSKFDEYNKKRGSWDLSPSHPKTLQFTEIDTISQLVEKVAVSTCKLTPEEQEELCYNCILVGHLPNELRPYWEDPKLSGGEYGTPAKVQVMSNQQASGISPSFVSSTVTIPTSLSYSGNSPMSSANMVAHAVQTLTASNLAATSGSVATPSSSGISNIVIQSPTSQGFPKVPVSVPAVASSSVAGVVSQFQSERLAAESQDRINSVISQVLKSSIQPLEALTAAAFMQNVPDPEIVEDVVDTLASEEPRVSVASTAFEITSNTMSRDGKREVKELTLHFAPSRVAGEKGRKDNVEYIALKESSESKPFVETLYKDSKIEQVEGSDIGKQEAETVNEEDEKESQVSSLDASTIAGERDGDSVNISTNSAIADDSAAAQLTSQSENSEDECNSLTTRQDKHNMEGDQTISGEIRIQSDQETVESTSVFCENNGSSSTEANLKEDEYLKCNKEKKSENDNLTCISEIEEKDSGSRKDSHLEKETKDTNFGTPKNLVAITKKDVAKQFHSIAMGENSFVSTSKLGETPMVCSSSTVRSIGVVQKDELEVKSEELPADLLTESQSPKNGSVGGAGSSSDVNKLKFDDESGDEVDNENEADREKEKEKAEENTEIVDSDQKKPESLEAATEPEPALQVESSWLVASLNRVPVENVELGIDVRTETTANDDDDDDDGGGDVKSEKDEEKKEKENDDETKHKTESSATSSNFDFSRINFDEADFNEDEDKK